MRLPLAEGFEVVELPGWRCAVRKDAKDVLLETAGGDPVRLAGVGEARYRGRGRPLRVVLADGAPSVLRRYLHGGLLARITGARFAGRSRPFAELRATEAARRAGVAVPEVLAAWHRRVLGFFHEGYLLTRQVPRARDLVDVLEAGETARPAFGRLGREVRKMHDGGVLHKDLHVKNVLVSEGAVTILDFDGARLLPEVSRSRRIANLLRFDRSVEKLSRRGIRVPRTDRMRFFASYFEEGLDRAERKAIVARWRRTLFLHRLAWMVFGSGR